MNRFYHSSTPSVPGSLHTLREEHDNCGMGAIANLNGERSHKVLEYALRSVSCMTHRGAVDADMKTGDGSGVLSQIPHPIFEKAAKDLGVELPGESIAVGVFFFPVGNEAVISDIRAKAEAAVAERGIEIIGWRVVPVDPEALGVLAKATQPQIEHLLMRRPEEVDGDAFERQLFLCRRRIELQTREVRDFYIPSFSGRLISYKALAMPEALKGFYCDLQDPDFETAIVLYHQRFSTNTFPAWPLGQPFRMLAHNGEINTVEGNRNWLSSREDYFESEVWGDDIELLKNLIREGESDSSSLDHALEVLVLSGRSLEHSMCMLVPPAYRNDEDISDDLRAFYQYIRSFSEPWDGPAGLVYTDGVKLCASLDRNGLRPSRFKLTEDGLLYIGSEAGAVVIDDCTVVRKGRLGPGQMLSANTLTGEFKNDREIKEALAKQKPYRQWIDENRLELRRFVSPEAHAPEDDFGATELSRQQVAHAISLEELDMVFPPMIKGAQEAVFSMGDDIPLAVLSSYPRLLYTYFKQRFAQVTNPPIDPIREWAVMTVSAGLGQERNWLAETPEHCKIVNVDAAILFEHQVERIKELASEGFPAGVLDMTWDVSSGPEGMKARLDALCREAEAAIDGGANILILSDRGISKDRVPIPSMLATGTVHHHLIRVRKRLRCSLVLESGEVRDTHQVACVFSVGATVVCPYLGFATVRQLVTQDRSKLGDEMTAEKAMENYRKALEKGLLKIMSKMGISVLNSYQGAQILEAIGIGKEVISASFAGMQSKIGGIGFAEIAEESLIRHRAAYTTEVAEGTSLDLGDPGYNRFRKSGERHALTTEVIKNFHTYVKSGKAEDYEGYVKASLENQPMAIKDLFEFVPSSAGPVPIDEVEPIESIRRRFTTAAMSLGALSPEAHETLAIAMNRIGAKSDSGEGGEDTKRFRPYPNGDLARSYIKQIASGRFGVSAHYLVNADELEIKMAQGAKPGEGGQLPGHKVNGLIAKLRNTQPGVQLISPPPHHDIYSIEDLAQLIHDLKEVNPRARVTVKLVAETGVGTVAAGVAKASADNILISGHDGGTAASPLSSTKHAGSPWELGLSEAQQTLMINNLRNRVVLRTDGGLRNGRDIVIAAILGAEEYNFGTIAMIAMGCVYVRKCHLNNCPVGVATTDPKWRAKFKGTPEMVIHFLDGVSQEAREIMASLGVRSLDELIGRPEFLRQREVPGHPKANTLDLGPVLKDVVPSLAAQRGVEPNTLARVRTQERNDGISKPALDLQILADLKRELGMGGSAEPAAIHYGVGSVEESTLEAIALLPDREPVTLSYDVVNTDRNIGTRLAGRIAEVHGNHGFSDQTAVTLRLSGTAGQSLGCFMVSGMRIELTGEANDYVGKGMAGGEIIVHPPSDARFEFHQNSIAGNTCLYGATGGRLFLNGRAGERFAVRNSGSVAVVEGVGDHGCEYMTNGTIVILGRTGKNFGAGMSGGTAFVYDVDGRFYSRVNNEMVVALPTKREADVVTLKALIEAHVAATGSPHGKAILANWEEHGRKFVRVIPKERAALEAAEEQHEAAAEPTASR
ncbi:glutamate synthase (NADPH/NADH) large chain/glutamate synthase (ferredoxin) [Haloferula luteola]|uniref:Glutamate synthase [NADPH] large chain n=1 Tax=Haloferula luteola TaxID=595692 RepID=A0A840UVW7_9BACT|nr:glutamate synthase large subunit [Haloferula luteola]MBB5349865.1 glutamate synthase (NADPH/NADH) large chain/glutamate synthase (ferredoxin) [Haloferula luteola]